MYIWELFCAEFWTVCFVAMSEVLMTLQEEGVLSKLYKEYVANETTTNCDAAAPSSQSSNSNALDVPDLAGVLLLHCLIMVLAVLGWLYPLSVHLRKKVTSNATAIATPPPPPPRPDEGNWRPSLGNLEVEVQSRENKVDNNEFSKALTLVEGSLIRTMQQMSSEHAAAIQDLERRLRTSIDQSALALRLVPTSQ